MSLVSTTRPARRRAQFYPLEVTAVERLTADAVAVTFAVPESLHEVYRFEPGQHLTLRATINGQEVRQSYSICLSRRQSATSGTLRVAAARVDGGRMSNWLNDAVAVGDVLDVMTPLGSFTCPVQPSGIRHHLAITAGSGITPVLSIITSVLEEEPGSEVTLLFGNRGTDSIMFLEELADLKNRYTERFQLVHVLSREPQDVELFTGRLDPERIGRILAALAPVDTVDEWYLCGPFGMVAGAQRLLADAGVDRHHVHHEVFHVVEQEAPGAPTAIGASTAPGEPAVVARGTAPAAVVTVNLDGRTTRIEMPSRDESILAATLRARPDAPYSCTGGVCGTCRARLVSGEVRMDRNYALEPEELAAGIVLACQSHPMSDEVALDYDA